MKNGLINSVLARGKRRIRFIIRMSLEIMLSFWCKRKKHVSFSLLHLLFYRSSRFICCTTFFNKFFAPFSIIFSFAYCSYLQNWRCSYRSPEKLWARTHKKKSDAPIRQNIYSARQHKTVDTSKRNKMRLSIIT